MKDLKKFFKRLKVTLKIGKKDQTGLIGVHKPR